MGTKISALTSQTGTNTEDVDLLYTVDVSETADADKGKKITIHELGKAINELSYSGFYLRDANGSNSLKLDWNEDDTGDRSLLFYVNGGTRQINLSGNLTVEASSIIDQDLTKDAVVEFAGIKIGPLKILGPQAEAIDDALMAATGTIEYTGIDNSETGDVYAQLASMNNLRTSHEELRARYNGLKDTMNELLTKLRTHGIISGPRLILTYPNGGESIPVGNSVDITWIDTDIGNSEFVNIAIRLENGNLLHIANNEPNDGLFAWDTSHLSGGSYVNKDARIYIWLVSNPDINDLSDSTFMVTE